VLSKLDFKPVEAAAFWSLNEMQVTEFEALAEKWLLEGLGGSELSVAAFGLPTNRFDADPLVQAVLHEFGLPVLSKKQCGWLAIHASLARLLDKLWPVYDAACFIVNLERDFNNTPIFNGLDPYMNDVRKKPRYISNGNKLFAGEGCRVNGIVAAYFSKDDYSFDAKKTDFTYDEFSKQRDKDVDEYIVSEAQAAWKHYFNLSTSLTQEYEKLKSFL